MCGRHRVLGFAMCCIGIGMLIVIIIPFWGWVLAVAMIVIGFLNLIDK